MKRATTLFLVILTCVAVIAVETVALWQAGDTNVPLVSQIGVSPASEVVHTTASLLQTMVPGEGFVLGERPTDAAQSIVEHVETANVTQSARESLEISQSAAIRTQDGFSFFGTLEEAGSMTESANRFWWLNSGGRFSVAGSIGRTIAGKLGSSDPWRKLYRKSNPSDTDDGYRPQNIFRLVSKSRWKNVRQQAYFRIAADNLSKSENRAESNGLLFLNRYQDGDNLYYTGIRVDGFAVIKKKIGGEYFTLAYDRVFPGQYDRAKRPNLLPHGSWIGLRSEVVNESDGLVHIRLFVDRGRSGDWQLVAEAKDNGRNFGGAPFRGDGYAGIRTDFMDVEFDNYKLEEIQ